MKIFLLTFSIWSDIISFRMNQRVSGIQNSKKIISTQFKKGTNKMYPQPLNNLQIEIIKLYSTSLNQKDLWELKQVLANHFAQKAIREADKIWKEQKLSNKDMEKWLNAE